MARRAPLEGLTRVVAAVIEREGRFLLCQRPAHKRHGGLWEFPGGKLAEGETLEAAARRELDEELELNLTRTGRTLFSRRDPGSTFQIEFVEVWADGEPRAMEHTDLRWLRWDELHSVPLAPTDDMFASNLASTHGGQNGE
jgi:8-oxo-dGTP diphosphatase